MKRLLETMYVLTPESYLYHRNENICVSIAGEEKASVPVHLVDSIVFFGKNTLSTSLIGFCAENHVTMSFLDANGRFYGRVNGPSSGNVLLRKRQYDSMNDAEFSAHLVRNILYGKICISKDEKTANELYLAAKRLSIQAQAFKKCTSVDSMRGQEGAAATTYFSVFDAMLSSPSGFRFETRSRRPPRNEVNAVLSFLYTQLAHDTRSALETVGLDPSAGYLHTLRPGRPSFALDLMEELRAPLCDRMTLTLFNRGQLAQQDFQTDMDSVYLNDKGRKTVLTAWRTRKHEEISHPF